MLTNIVQLKLKCMCVKAGHSQARAAPDDRPLPKMHKPSHICQLTFTDLSSDLHANVIPNNTKTFIRFVRHSSKYFVLWCDIVTRQPPLTEPDNNKTALIHSLGHT